MINLDAAAAVDEKTPARQTRKEKQAQTRERLIAVAREHFLQHGLGGSVLEKIAEEAGFTRGAFYANFHGREDLFLAVVQSSVDAELGNFRSILESEAAPQERLQRMRETFGNLVSNPGWVLLEAEFQANALRNPEVRSAFLIHLNRRMTEGAELLRQFGEELGLVLRASPEEVALVLAVLAEGLAVRQAITRQHDTSRIRALAMLCFDQIVSLEVVPDIPE